MVQERWNMRTSRSAWGGAVDKQTKAVVVRADANIQTDVVNFNIGGSAYNLPTEGGPGKTQILGAFGVISYDNNLTLQAEYDMITTHNSSAILISFGSLGGSPDNGSTSSDERRWDIATPTSIIKEIICLFV